MGIDQMLSWDILLVTATLPSTGGGRATVIAMGRSLSAVCLPFSLHIHGHNYSIVGGAVCCSSQVKEWFEGITE